MTSYLYRLFFVLLPWTFKCVSRVVLVSENSAIVMMTIPWSQLFLLLLYIDTCIVTKPCETANRYLDQIKSHILANIGSCITDVIVTDIKVLIKVAITLPQSPVLSDFPIMR